MKIWEIVIEARGKWRQSSTYEYLGVAATSEVAIHQVIRLARKDFISIEIKSVRRLGELDFCTKK